MRHLVLLIGLLSATANAQEPAYTWGAPITPVDPDSHLEKVLGTDDDGIFIVRARGPMYDRSYWVEHLAPSLNSLSFDHIEFNSGVMGNSQSLAGFERIGGVNYAFVKKWNKAVKEQSFHVARIERTRLVKEVKLASMNAKSEMAGGVFSTAISTDGSKLLVFLDLPFEKDAQEKVALRVFNTANWSLLYDKQITQDHESIKGGQYTPTVDNEGNVFLYHRWFAKPDYNYSFYKYDRPGDRWQKASIDFSGKTVLEHMLVFDNENRANLVGIYSTDKTVTVGVPVNGFFWYRFERQGVSLDLSRVYDWPLNVLQAAHPGKRNIEVGMAIPSYMLKDILFRGDNSMMLLLENFQQTRQKVEGVTPPHYRYTNKYGPILIVTFDDLSDKVLWAQRFDKHQEVQSDNEVNVFGSFVYYLNNDRLTIIYNNTDLSIPSIPPAFWKEPDGTKYVKHQAFGDKTMHASFLQIIEPNGDMAFANRTHGEPLLHMHEDAVFPMSMTTDFFQPYSSGLVVKAEMHGGKRYRYGLISY